MAIDPRARPIIAGFGAFHPLGANSRQVAMSARARKLEPRSSEHLDKRGKSVGLCRASSIPDRARGVERLVALALPALREAAAGAASPARIPMFLSIAESGRPDQHPRAAADLIAALARESGVPIDEARSRAVAAGQAGGAIALEAACALLASGGARAALVGGVDSYADPDVLGWLDRECRLHSVDAENGFIPSEGAAFVLLVTDRVRGAIARVAAIETGREKTVGSDQPNLGDCMTELLARIAATCGGPLEWALPDLNGERHRNKEWRKTAFRGSLAADAIEQRLADDLGDVGAASGPMYLAIACALWRDGPAPSRRALIALHSDGQERGAFVVEAEEPQQTGAPTVEATAETVVRAIASHAADALEESLLALATAPSRLGADAVGAVGAAMEALAHAGATPIDDPLHLDRLDGSLRAVERAAQVVEGADGGSAMGFAAATLASVSSALRACRPRAVEQVAAALPSGSPRIAAASPESAPFRASIGVPRLHRLGRGPLPPSVVALEDDDALLEEDEGDEEDEGHEDDQERQDAGAPIDDGPASQVAPAGSPHPQRRLARDCMEDVGLLGGLRSPPPEHTWTPELARFEQRLLDSLDALIALGLPGPGSPPGDPGPIDVLAELESWANEAFVADPTRAFARAFVLGCVDGDDRVRAAVLALRQSDPSTHRVQRIALALAPNRAIPAAMTRLCMGEDVAHIRLALDVLRARGEVPFAAAGVLLSHPDPLVAADAARALAVAPHREAVMAILEAQIDVEADDVVAVAVAEGLAALGSSIGLHHVRRRLVHEREAPGTLSPVARRTAIRLVGVTGGDEDVELMIALLAQDPGGASGMGWLGHVALVEPLIAALAAERRRTWRSEAARELAAALHRITGAPAVRVGERESEEPAPAIPVLVEPVSSALLLEPDVWAAWWAEHRAGFARSRRHRFGRLHTPLATLDELDASDVPMAAREVAALELFIASEGVSRLHPEDWVVRQQEATTELRDLWTKLPTEAGEWPSRRLGPARRRG